MSGYRRFVSYIYGYDQGEKKENTGFVKVNARGGECKIWVHMRGFYARGQRPYQVYAFTQRRERLEGQYLGELESRNGALEWNGVTDTESLNGGFGLEESRGIFIEGSNRVYAAEWDDYPVEVERFQPVKVSARQSVQEPSEDMDAVRAAQVQPEEESESEPEDTEESEDIEEPEEKQPEEEQMEKKQPEDGRREQWNYLKAHFHAAEYRDEEGKTLEGIRLGNRELSRIPRDRWGLGNNSFLLHGFYQHHHLLLLRAETGGAAAYYIGVPGIYNEKEQMLASMFGFEEFKPLKKQGEHSGGPGYWCRLLK